MGREGVLSIMYYTEQHMTKRVFAPQEPGHISKSDKIECNTFIAGPLYKPHDKKPCRTGESVGDMYKSVWWYLNHGSRMRPPGLNSPNQKTPDKIPAISCTLFIRIKKHLSQASVMYLSSIPASPLPGHIISKLRAAAFPYSDDDKTRAQNCWPIRLHLLTSRKNVL